MRNTEILERCEFMTLLRTAIDEQPEQDEIRLEHAYNQVLSRVERLSRSDRKSALEKLRLFTYACEVLERLKSKLTDHNSTGYLYARSAGSILSFEKHVLLLQLKYPGMNESGKTRRRPPFRLSKEYTPTDLMEVVILFYAIGFFRMPDDTPAPLHKLTHEFEAICGVKIKSPDSTRWSILNRKIKLTHFIEILRNKLIDLSQR